MGDDHPRHVVYAPGAPEAVPSDETISTALANIQADKPGAAQALKDLMDTASIMRHMDCCREVGCPDGSCSVVTEGAEDLKGSDLVQHLTSREN